MKNSIHIYSILCLLLISFQLCSQNFNETLTEIQDDLKQVRNVQESMLEDNLKSRVQKVVNTTEFVRSANVSLSALVLSNSLTDYLNNVTDLNNPTNRDLGFSLVKSIDKLIEDEIFKGKDRVGGAGKGKFLQIVDNILAMPLIKTFTTTIPVVSSLTSITQLVTNTAITDKNVSSKDLENFREEIGVFIAHYEGLASASRDFNAKITVVSERTLAISLMLRSFAYQRIGSLKPNIIENETLKNKSLREMLLDHYDQISVRNQIKEVLASYTSDDKLDIQGALASDRLNYPDFVINEARFILDEIETISKEYLVAFDEYQVALEGVLNHSKDIGDPEKIDRKIDELRYKLKEVEAAFLNAVHVEDVNRKFDLLINSDAQSEALIK